MVEMTLHFILFKKATSLTNLFLMKILHICKNGSMIIIFLKPRKMLLYDLCFQYHKDEFALKMAQLYLLQKSM